MVLNEAMRIGQLAEIVGVSTRTVRHYHHEGLLAEPARDSSGYRRYSVADLARLLRIRHLRELGVGVSDVRRVLRAEPEQGIRAVLEELDSGLAAQEQSVRRMRERIQGILAVPELDALKNAYDPESHDTFLLLKELGAEGASCRMDQTFLSVIPAEAAQGWTKTWENLLTDSVSADVLASSYAEFDALVSVEPDDPRVQALTDQVWNLMPDDYLSELAAGEDTEDGSAAVQALTESLSPAQARVMELITDRMSLLRTSEDESGAQPR